MNDKAYPWQVLSVTSLGVLLVTLNLGTLTIALPEVSAYFHAGAVVTSWVLLSYMLFNTVLILVFGKLADIYGRRTLYLIGLAEFTAVSFLCGFAEYRHPDRPADFAGGWRGSRYHEYDAAHYGSFLQTPIGYGLGINVLVASVAQLLGPVVGGFLVYAFGWRWVFWFNVPLGVAGVIWGLLALRPVPGQAQDETIDYLGNLFLFLGLGGLIFAFSEGGVSGWSSLPVTTGLLLFAFSSVFVWWERRVKHPTVDFVLFRRRSYAMANLAAFFNSLGRSSVVLLIALYYQVMNKENTFTAGLNVLPVTVGMIVASPAAGMLSAKYSTRILSTSGLLGTCVGMLVLVWNIGEHASSMWIWIGQGLVGIGTGL